MSRKKYATMPVDRVRDIRSDPETSYSFLVSLNEKGILNSEQNESSKAECVSTAKPLELVEKTSNYKL